MNINTDYILIRDAKRGNTKAVERIIRKYYVSIFDFCRYPPLVLDRAYHAYRFSPN